MKIGDEDSTVVVLSFGPYRLDRIGGRLLCGSTEVPLRPKALAVLEYLAARPGRLVRSDELLDAAWPGTHVTPSVLTGCIRELRRALGDDARAARFIETAHRRGYRFVATFTTGAAPSAAAPALISQRRVLMLGCELAELARRFADVVLGALDRDSKDEQSDTGNDQSRAQRLRAGRAGRRPPKQPAPCTAPRIRRRRR